jgi:hypothetical protein
MNESFAGGLDDAIIEHFAEFLIHKLSEIFLIVLHVVVHHPQNDHTQRTTVIKTLESCTLEICAGTFISHLCHYCFHPIEVFVPIDQQGMTDKITHKLATS